MSEPTNGTAVVLSPRAAEAIQTLRHFTDGWCIGKCEAHGGGTEAGFAGLIRKIADQEIKQFGHGPVDAREIRRIFGAIGDLLDELQAMDNSCVADPDPDIDDEPDYGDAGGSPELRAAQDRDRP